MARQSEKKLILVVDDEENIRLLFQQELEDEGYSVIYAENGNQALEMLDKATPDLITLDMEMPGLSGLETLSKIKEKDKDIPVVICSSYPDYQDNFSSWSSDAYIVKTANKGLENLKHKIAEILKKG